jgi:hypothetical protein
MDARYLTDSFLHMMEGYLLGALGLLSQDVSLGRLSFATGALAMLGALGWGGVVLWRARRG